MGWGMGSMGEAGNEAGQGRRSSGGEVYSNKDCAAPRGRETYYATYCKKPYDNDHCFGKILHVRPNLPRRRL